MSGGEFDWGGRLRKGIGGAQRSSQNGWKPFAECKGCLLYTSGYRVKTVKLPAAAIPKAQVLEQPDGLLKAVLDADTNKILGAHLFCEESHELINLIKMAMDVGLDYTVLKNMIFTHPTMGEALNDLFSV